MASRIAATTAAEVPNRCDIVEDPDQSKSEPVQLSNFLSGLSASEDFQRTADYARSPETYLRNTLGSHVFDERKELLSVTDKVDKDIYGTGEHKTHFEQHIANLFGKAHGLFFVTGVQAQLAALKIHCDRAENNRVAWHETSHLEAAELRAYDLLYGLERHLLGSAKEENPSVEDIKQVLALPEDRRPAVILLEIPNRTLGCATYSFADLETIASACKEANVKFHCDGARIWEIEPYYQETAGKTFTDIAQLFDSIYVSFYKGLRGATGAMLLCKEESLITEAKKWQRRAGGNAFSLGYEVVDCERGYNENIGTFAAKAKKMQEVCEGVTIATAKFKTSDGAQIISFMPPQPTCSNVRTVFLGYTADELLAARDRVAEKHKVRVFERLPPKKSLDDQMESGKPLKEQKPDPGDLRNVSEWMIVGDTLGLETSVFVDAYVALCEELQAGASEP